MSPWKIYVRGEPESRLRIVRKALNLLVAGLIQHVDRSNPQAEEASLGSVVCAVFPAFHTLPLFYTYSLDCKGPQLGVYPKPSRQKD